MTGAATLLNLRSLLDRWSTGVPLWIDNRFQAWTVHWVQGALSGDHSLYDANTFAPVARSLTFSDHLIGIAVPLLPLRWIGLSPAAIFNTGVVLGTVGAAVAGYVLGYVLTRSVPAAIVAGGVSALGPLPFDFTTHIHVVWRAGLAIVAAITWVLADRTSQRDPWTSLVSDRALLVLLGATVAWQSLVSFMYVPFVVVTAGAVLLVRRRDLGRRIWTATLAVAMGLLAAMPSYLPYLQTRRDHPDFAWELDDIGILRAAPQAVDDGNVLWGWLLGRPTFSGEGAHSFPGLTVIVLAIAGVAFWAMRRGRRDRAPVLAAVLIFVGGLGALGPGWGWSQEWTPYSLAFRFVPTFSAVRASQRFMVVVLLGAAALAAWATTQSLEWYEQRRVAGDRRRMSQLGGAFAVTALAALTVEGYNDGRQVTTATPHAIDEAIRAQDDGGVVYLPLAYENLADFAIQEEFVFRSTAHDRTIVNGYAGYYPRSAWTLARRLQALPDVAALDCLAAYEIRYVVVSDHVANGPWAGLANRSRARPLELVAETQGEYLYRIPDRQASAEACPIPGVDRTGS